MDVLPPTILSRIICFILVTPFLIIFSHDFNWHILLIIHKFLSKEANLACENIRFSSLFLLAKRSERRRARRNGCFRRLKRIRTYSPVRKQFTGVVEARRGLVCRSTNKIVRLEGSRLFWPLGFFPATNRLQVFMFLLLRRRMGEITASLQKQDTRK